MVRYLHWRTVYASSMPWAFLSYHPGSICYHLVRPKTLFFVLEGTTNHSAYSQNRTEKHLRISPEACLRQTLIPSECLDCWLWRKKRFQRMMKEKRLQRWTYLRVIEGEIKKKKTQMKMIRRSFFIYWRDEWWRRNEEERWSCWGLRTSDLVGCFLFGVWPFEGFYICKGGK